MALILHIETATKVCSVALSDNGKLLEFKETKEDGYTHGENLTVFIKDVLESSDRSIESLDAVSLSSGPGSYTGLRIGAATAKAICFAQNIPLIAIDALLSLASIAAKKHNGINLCAVLDARRMEVYNQFFSSDLNPLKDITADIIDENSYASFEPFVYFGDGAAKLEEIWKNRNCQIDETIDSSAIGQVELAFDKYQQKDFVDVSYWEPFYLKDFVLGKKKS